MPTTSYFPKNAGRSGIDITWTPSAGRIDISGWYDTYVGLEGESLSLREFFDRLRITKAQCLAAWNETDSLAPRQDGPPVFSTTPEGG